MLKPTAVMQAIETEYRGATNFLGSRIVAKCAGGRITVPYDHALNSTENHRGAAEALVAKLGRTSARHGELVTGALKGQNYVHVFTGPVEALTAPSALTELTDALTTLKSGIIAP